MSHSKVFGNKDSQRLKLRLKTTILFEVNLRGNKNIIVFFAMILDKTSIKHCSKFHLQLFTNNENIVKKPPKLFGFKTPPSIVYSCKEMS